jgi:hypothetical protein
MKVAKIARCGGILIVAQLYALSPNAPTDRSLFSNRISESRLVKDAFAFIESNRAVAIAEWIALTEIPAPSGKEEARAAVLREKFSAAGLEGVKIDAAGNVGSRQADRGLGPHGHGLPGR